ncbi:transcriptional regulator [Pseudoroseomonas rhizosphaerae]|uniref:Transcriptional regulator n=2 Tax=Teichococcus rhizosphaerae TaxID=1335062 RepID=A0A2C7AA00_9PROT|nr:PTS sugar transporter subunit IIA [Pseudoroseomonas rhizosphaerae]PHK94225.1 transcriptional regulator [Pseudoroseomonas rhizosphaerae]
MPIKELFHQENSVLSLSPKDKKELLEMLADEAAARLQYDRQKVLEALQAREKLGSTALGRGIGLPHTRLEGLGAPLALLARLARPIEFDARDGEPVDLVFMVLWPENSAEGFLPALSGICRVLRGNQLARQLRQAQSGTEALAMLQSSEAESPDEPA